MNEKRIEKERGGWKKLVESTRSWQNYYTQHSTEPLQLYYT